MSTSVTIQNQSRNKTKLCYRDTSRFIVHIESDEIYADFAGDIEKSFDISKCEVKRPQPIRKNENVMRLMKDELDGRIIKEFVALKSKMYSYLTDYGHVDRKTKRTVPNKTIT